jgi:hypothetical protein
VDDIAVDLTAESDDGYEPTDEEFAWMAQEAGELDDGYEPTDDDLDWMAREDGYRDHEHARHLTHCKTTALVHRHARPSQRPAARRPRRRRSVSVARRRTAARAGPDDSDPHPAPAERRAA